MAAFQFRLATLLKLRESERRQRQIESAQALEAERILQRQAEAVANDIALAKAKLREASSPGELPVDSLLEFQRYTLQLTAQALVVAEQMSTLRAEVERRRQVLIEADRTVRTLEKLRDQQAATFRLEAETRERKMFDEIAQQQFFQTRGD